MEEKLHNITLENRKKLSATLCSEVISFDENEVVLVSGGAQIVVKGKMLTVDEVSKTSGDVVVSGESIDSIVYQKGREKSKEGIFRRILK